MIQNGASNGQYDMNRVAEILLGGPMTLGYRPTLPLWSLFNQDWTPQIYLMRDIELMMIHPVVRSALNYFKAGVSGAQFWGGEDPLDPTNSQGLPICPENPEVEEFVQEHCHRYWDRGVPKLQNGYEYGWIGAENLYAEIKGRMCWNTLNDFSPRDSYLLTQGSKPVGVRIKNIRPNATGDESGTAAATGYADLWLATHDIPAKGLWYVHKPRYNLFYGQSQLLGAWRPWRRLAWKDAAETVVDGGIYRFAYAGPVIRYPEEDFLAPANSPATTLDAQGRSRKWARDVARQMAEWYKTGAGVGIPSTKYAPEQGGGDKWGFELPKSTLNVDGLISYIQYLCDQIRYGVEVPPEVLEAAETGSGYSGRSIPLEGFLMQQQKLADALLTLFVEQVLRPLVRWNFGDVRFQVQVKPLIRTKGEQMQMAQQPGQVSPGMGAGGMPPQANGMPNNPDAGQSGLADEGGWSPHTGPNGQQGWKSRGGRVMYTPQIPGQGFSVTNDRLREAVLKIIRRAA